LCCQGTLSFTAASQNRIRNLSPWMKIPVFSNLPLERPGSQLRSARVCIATYEILGPSQGGGIGAAYFSLARALAIAGHEVTIMYLSGALSDQGKREHWRSHFRALGIEFVPLLATRGTIDVPRCMLTARDAHAWLRKQNFDVIHFPELQGHGYYSVVAKSQSLDFSHTTLCIGAHSPISWIREQNNEAPYSPDELEMDFMERQCVALADVVISPSQYMLRWMQTRGWTLPVASYVQQNITPPELTAVASLAKRRSELQRPTEIVFFGKLEERKGLGLFCNALDRLAGSDLSGIRVTFLGKEGRVSGLDAATYIRAHAEHWSFSCRVLTDYGHEAAMRFLLEDAGRIAIIPSLEDNLPNTVLECLAGNIPFLASAGGGIPELIAARDLGKVTFAPNVRELADRLTRALQDGVPVARPAIDAEENKQRWIDWHAALVSRYAERQSAETEFCVTPPAPLVTVCLNYRGRPELLRQSLGSLRRQSWPRLEVIVSDCSTKGTDAHSEFDALSNDFRSKRWRIIRKSESQADDALSVAVDHARGEHVLFLDAADYLDYEAVATFVKVATCTDADILTCFLAFFSGASEPTEESCLGRYPFLGAAILPGVFHNYFGSNVIFARRHALSRIGLFREDSRPSCAHWEFLARAVLTGCQLQVIPRALAWCRIPDDSEPHVRIDYKDQVRALAPYAEAMPAALRDLPKAALTMKFHYEYFYGLAHGNETSLLDDKAILSIVKEMPAQARKRFISALEAWLEYSSARSHLPARRLQRLPRIARQLLRGRYHRFAHGFGSALRDLRKAPKPG
jgi:O-antigen biosynthesis protein